MLAEVIPWKHLTRERSILKGGHALELEITNVFKDAYILLLRRRAIVANVMPYLEAEILAAPNKVLSGKMMWNQV